MEPIVHAPLGSPHHLVVGGQRSGKSRHAEALARRWREGGPGRGVVVVATAVAGDDEMRARIERHQRDRPTGFSTVEAPRQLAQALRDAAGPGRLLLVDCLTLWLTNWLMPLEGEADLAAWEDERQGLLATLPGLASPVVFVSNEVGWGVVPLGAGMRRFVDELGALNQAVGRRCGQLTLMVAGQPWTRAVDAAVP